MVSSDSRPVTAVANEVAELREAIAREAAMAEELLSVKSELQRLRDDSDFERVEWEREKRGELLDAKGETRERGCQTDTEEEAALQEKKELSEREVSRVTHNERVRHKPRFIVPLPEEPLAQEPRDAMPLEVAGVAAAVRDVALRVHEAAAPVGTGLNRAQVRAESVTPLAPRRVEVD